jgi:cytochrome c5
MRRPTVAAVAGLVLGVVNATAQELPAGAGRDIAASRCLTCHDADIIAGQRLSRTGWDREVTKMIRWGAMVPDAERAPLVDYLALAFAVAPAAAPADPALVARGARVRDAACLVCHDDDIIEGQRLTPAGWGREVDKMVRWGAHLDPADRDALVAFLASR